MELHCGRRRGGDRRRRRPQQRHGGADSPDHDAGVALQVKLNLKPVRREAGIILRIDRLCEPRMSVCILNILNLRRDGFPAITSHKSLNGICTLIRCASSM